VTATLADVVSDRPLRVDDSQEIAMDIWRYVPACAPPLSADSPGGWLPCRLSPQAGCGVPPLSQRGGGPRVRGRARGIPPPRGRALGEGAYICGSGRLQLARVYPQHHNDDASVLCRLSATHVCLLLPQISSLLPFKSVDAVRRRYTLLEVSWPPLSGCLCCAQRLSASPPRNAGRRAEHREWTGSGAELRGA
jgi:hypothetical protein